MADEIGLGRHWFHRDHFDIPKKRRIEIESNCLIVSSRTIVRLIHAHHKIQTNMSFENIGKSPRMPGLSAEKLAKKCDVKWTENMDHEAVLFEYYKKNGANKLHRCPDWDYMTIHDRSPEFEACTCYAETK